MWFYLNIKWLAILSALRYCGFSKLFNYNNRRYHKADNGLHNN